MKDSHSMLDVHPKKIEMMTSFLKIPELFSIVEIEINHECNLKCSYCPIAYEERIEQGRMPPELFNKLLDQLVDCKFKGRISYHFYNEPMLSPDLLDYIKETVKRLPECKIDMSTNGTFLTLKKFEELIEAGLDRFTITKHENLKRWVFDETWMQLTEKQKGMVSFTQFKDLPMDNRGGILKEVGDQRSCAALPCLIPSFLTVVTVKGNVLPCYEDFRQVEVMGNINQQSLFDIWNTSKYKKFRNTLAQKNSREKFSICKDCSNARIFPNKFGATFNKDTPKK